MGTSVLHALGRDRRAFFKTETTVMPSLTGANYIKPLAGDAAKMLSLSFSHAVARSDRADSRTGTRDVLERITGREENSWSANGYLIPSGTAGTPPDVHPLLLAVMGAYENTSETSDAYTLSASQSALGTVTIAQEASAVVSEVLYGAGVESMSVNFSGGEEPKISFEGFAKGYVLTGTSTLNGAMAASPTMIVQTADAYNFKVGSIVQIGSDNNTGAGYRIIAGTGPSFTIESSISADDAAAVIPYLPTETVGAGVPNPGILGSISYAGAATMFVTAADFSIKNNHKVVADEAFKQQATDYIPGWREVSGTLTVRARKDWIINLANRESFATVAINLVSGTTAGAIMTAAFPYAEIEFGNLELPESEEGTFTLPFKALGSSGEDSFSLTFT